MKRITLVAVVLTLLSSACSTEEEGATAPTATKITVKTSEYKFELPATFAGGLVELTLDNSAGAESHEAELTKLDDGKTLADFKAAAKVDGPPPSWAKSSGGPGPVLAGKSAVYTANLTAGTYALACHVPAPDGTAHVDKGMVGQTTVTAGTAGTLPAGDVSLGTQEFKFTGTEGLRAGNQTVKVTNSGTQAHHVAIFALAPGKKTSDVAAFFGAAAPSGPPPFTGVAGLIGTLVPGDEALRTLELEAGTTYMFACFIPDTDGTPHFAKGMTAEITPT